VQAVAGRVGHDGRGEEAEQPDLGGRADQRDLLPAFNGATASATVAQTTARASTTRQRPSRGTSSRSTTATAVMAAEPPTQTGVSTK
jgi:hypothetical protein